MKAVEFQGTVAPGGQIALPPEIASEIPPGEQLRVLLMWDPSNLDQAWRATGRQRFEEAYVSEDAVYERLVDDAPIR